MLPIVDSSSSLSRYVGFFPNSAGLHHMSIGTLTACRYLPISPLPPLLLIPHDICNLAVELVLTIIKCSSVDEDEPATFQPYRRSEACRQLHEQWLLSSRQFDRPEIFALALDDFGNYMPVAQGSRRSGCLLRSRQELALRFGHIWSTSQVSMECEEKFQTGNSSAPKRQVCRGPCARKGNFRPSGRFYFGDTPTCGRIRFDSEGLSIILYNYRTLWPGRAFISSIIPFYSSCLS